MLILRQKSFQAYFVAPPPTWKPYNPIAILISPHVPIGSGAPEICAKYTGSMKDMKCVYFYELLNAYTALKVKW